MLRKLFAVLLGAVVVLDLGALFSMPAAAGRCKPDPNPNGRDHCVYDCRGPCETLVCVQGGKCPFVCQPIAGCVPPSSR